MPRTRRSTKAVLGLLTTTMSLVFLFGGIATAHVTVQPPEAEQGSYTKLTFRVPNELPDASTTGLRVQLPPDHPFASVSVKPKAGWTAETKTTTLATPIQSDDGSITEAVTEVDWSGGEIKPGEFDEFEISVGPLPDDVTELSFPAIQTYGNGQEVAWIDQPDAGGAEPEHPAPTLELTAASSDGHGSTTATSAIGASATGASASGENQTAASSSDDSDSSNGLAIAALVVGGVAIVLSIAALAMRARKPTSSA